MWSIIVPPPPAKWLLLCISAAAHWHRSPLSLLIFDLSLEEAAGGHVTTSPLLQQKNQQKNFLIFLEQLQTASDFSLQSQTGRMNHFCHVFAWRRQKEFQRLSELGFLWTVSTESLLPLEWLGELSVTENKRVNEDQTQRGDVTHWDHSSTN